MRWEERILKTQPEYDEIERKANGPGGEISKKRFNQGLRETGRYVVEITHFLSLALKGGEGG